MKARYIVIWTEYNQFGKLEMDRISCDTLEEAKELKRHFEGFESVQHIEIIYYISRPYKSYSKTIETFQRGK